MKKIMASVVHRLRNTGSRYIARHRGWRLMQARAAEIRKHGADLTLVQDNTAAIRPRDILLVVCLRNEAHRLPFFLDYYRRLGVDRFLIVDNDSTDGFRDYVKPMGDVSVWSTKASYLASNFGMQWCNHLLASYGVGHLCVTVDPDEFLVYPHIETRALADLGVFLKDENRACMHTLMLDAYSDRPVRETLYHSGDNPFETCPYFDRDGYIQRDGFGGGTFIQGGPRMRVFNRDDPYHAPALNKISVVWWEKTYAYRSSMHDMLPLKLNRAHHDGAVSITGCLFHFKFISTLEQKALEEAERKQHYAGGREYEKYRDQIESSLFQEGVSLRYRAPQQLIDLGLMSPGGWS